MVPESHRKHLRPEPSLLGRRAGKRDIGFLTNRNASRKFMYHQRIGEPVPPIGLLEFSIVKG